MRKKENKTMLHQMAGTLIGAFLFAAGVNIIIMPMNLYNGGFMGVAQLIRTFIVKIFHIHVSNFDLAGIVYYIINIPLFYWAWKYVGKSFFLRTIFAATFQTVFLTVIPVPSVPVISDLLTACIIGGLIVGAGTGIILRNGGSGGGQDIIGVICTKQYPGFSVGRISMMINIFVYTICFFMFNIEIVIYSLIYSAVLSFTLDKVHVQNINMSVIIFTKQTGISDAVMREMGRGVTNWEGTGAYTNETSHILYVVVNKYEISQLKRIVNRIDPDAFMILNEGSMIVGNFEKRL